MPPQGRKSKTNTMTPEEKMKRARRAKLRFRSLVRFIIANLFWMSDVEGEETLGVDFKKNIALLMKKKKQQKSLLSLLEKYILSKRAEDRSPDEKHHLFRVIGNLKCFRKYPEHVKMQLAAVTYFVYYGPGRVIVKQNREGHSLYFIVTGEVAVSITTFDAVLNEMKTVTVGTMVQGQMFGEVSLLHDIPRTATITTITDCELLCLQKDDFNIILKSSLQAQWDEILLAIKRFEYFVDWNEVDKRECCIYAKTKFYSKNDLVYDATFVEPYSYFILKGQCKIIEELPIITQYNHNVPSYFLFNRKKYEEFLKYQENLDDEEDESTYEQKAKQSRKSALNSFIKNNAKEKSTLSKSKTTSVTHLPRVTAQSKATLKKSTAISLGKITPSRQVLHKESMRIQKKPSSLSHRRTVESQGRGSNRISKQNVMKQIAKFEEKVEEKEDDTTFKYPDYVDQIFMQVCYLNETACFNVGENLNNRIVVAETDVLCLQIPKYWLLQRNKGNVWMKVQQFLNNNIPNTDEVFFVFTENRKWADHKRRLVNDIRKKPPCNKINNVPYSIRLSEDIPCCDCYAV